MSSPLYLTLNELFANFARKVGLNEKYLGRSLIFIYNGQSLDSNDQSLIGSLLFYSDIKITVVEIDGINNG